MHLSIPISRPAPTQIYFLRLVSYHIGMDMLTFSFDVVIALLSILILVKLTGYGGLIGDALKMIGYGVIIIGISQFIETIGLYAMGEEMHSTDVVHFFHRLVLLSGMLLVFFGFRKLMEGK